MTRASRDVLRLLAALALCGLALAASACLNLPDFEDASIIRGPRVVAVFAEPPEINPGQSLELSLMLAGTDPDSEIEVRWSACGSFDGFGGGGGQFGETQADEGCGGALSFDLGEGMTATLPGALTSGLFDNLEVIAMTLGTALPPGVVDQIRKSVGIAFLVEARIRIDGKLVRATKRVLISEREAPHTNPPPPRFMFGVPDGAAIVTEPNDPRRCVREDGEPVVVRPGARVELAPLTSPVVDDGDGLDGTPLEPDAGTPADEETWLETYNILNSRGEVRERKETAFYSWYATGGDLSSGTTKSPLRNNLWTAPRAAGEHTLWLIVRDGHGGTSACELAVTVEAPAAP